MSWKGSVPENMECCDQAEHMYVSEALSLKDVEAESLAEFVGDHRIPNVPFGFANEKWKSFKADFMPGDELVRFVTPILPSRHDIAGYFRLRNGCIQDIFITRT